MKKMTLIATLLAILLVGCDADSQWKLAANSGPENIIYEGEAVLKGQIIYAPQEVYSQGWYFQIEKDSLKDLPEIFAGKPFLSQFILIENGKPLTNSKLTEVIATKAVIPMEGHPLLYLKTAP